LKYGIFLPRFVLEVKQGSHTLRISKAHGDLNQLWDFEGDGKIRSKLGLVLDVGLERPQHGTPVVVFTKTFERYQGFRIVPVSG
jgi:hypothetical protein